MPTDINRATVQQLLGRGAQLVEVLGESEYHDQHLPGAINIPLRKLDRATVAQLQPDHPVIVYCHDTQ
jgi:rhodanese-related sulfurtransferase